MQTGYSEDDFSTETSDMAFEHEKTVTKRYADAKENHVFAFYNGQSMPKRSR